MKISVLLADNSEIMRKVIVDLLNGDPEIELVAECVTWKLMKWAAISRIAYGNSCIAYSLTSEEYPRNAKVAKRIRNSP